MPSGKTHDRITLWSLPWIVGLTFVFTRSGELTLLVSGGFLFSGLMFGPDLDIYSVQFKRWGWLRRLWLPYQKMMRHRSFFSHGLIIGTSLRLLYLGVFLAIISIFSVAIAQLIWGFPWHWQEFIQFLGRQFLVYKLEAIALFLGLELGAMSHAFSDWSNSNYKKWKKKRKRKPPQSKKKF